MPGDIEVVKLSKTYPPRLTPRSLLTGRRGPARAALQEVSFQVGAGEVLGIIGPNGAGKSTLLRILAGVLLPTSGSARVAGADVVSRRAEARRHVGAALSDDRGLSARLTPRQNLEFYGALYGLEPAAVSARIRDLSNRLDATRLLDREVRTLSSGEKARVVLMRALLHSPHAVLLDELTRSLDPGAAERVRRHIREDVRDHQSALVLASHDLQEVEALCTRVLLLAQGRVVALGPFSEVKAAADRVFALGAEAAG